MIIVLIQAAWENTGKAHSDSDSTKLFTVCAGERNHRADQGKE
jgi:hypothetical protein